MCHSFSISNSLPWIVELLALSLCKFHKRFFVLCVFCVFRQTIQIIHFCFVQSVHIC